MSLAAASDVEGSDPAEVGASSAEGAEPGAGDTVTTMDVKVSDDALTVIPDAEMLAGTEASAFPLYIDPTVTWGESERTLLRSDGYESYGWGNGDDGLGKGAGKCGTWSGYYCGPGYVQRLYFEFSCGEPEGQAGPGRHVPGDRAVGVPVRSALGGSGAHEQYLLLHHLVLAAQGA